MASIAERVALGEIGLEGEIEICTMNPLTGRPWQYQKVKNVVCQSMYDYIRLLIKGALTQTSYDAWYMKGLAAVPSFYSKVDISKCDLNNPAGFLYLTDGLLPEDRHHYSLDGNIIGFADLSNKASTDLRKGMLTPAASYSYGNEVYRRWDFASDRAKGEIKKISLARLDVGTSLNDIGAYGEEVSLNIPNSNFRYAKKINGEYWVCTSISQTEIRFERYGLEGRAAVKLGEVVSSLPEAQIKLSMDANNIKFCYNQAADKVYFSSVGASSVGSSNTGVFYMNLDGSECTFISFTADTSTSNYGFISSGNYIAFYSYERYTKLYRYIVDARDNTLIDRSYTVKATEINGFTNAFEINGRAFAAYERNLYEVVDDALTLERRGTIPAISTGGNILDLVGDKVLIATSAHNFPIVYSVPADDKHPCNLMTEKLLPEPVVKGDMPMYVGYTLRLV